MSRGIWGVNELFSQTPSIFFSKIIQYTSMYLFHILSPTHTCEDTINLELLSALCTSSSAIVTTTLLLSSLLWLPTDSTSTCVANAGKFECVLEKIRSMMHGVPTFSLKCVLCGVSSVNGDESLSSFEKTFSDSSSRVWILMEISIPRVYSTNLWALMMLPCCTPERLFLEKI